MPERLVVVGGDAAGMSAASQARRRRGPEELEIIAFERGRFTSYSACGIPYFVGGIVGEVDSLVVRTAQTFRDEYAIDARTGHDVLEVDLGRRAVRVRSSEANETWIGFDQLMVATGAVPIRPSLPGVDAANIFGVQVLDDGVAIARALEGGGHRSAVVVGGGYIGLEMAEAFVRRGLDVSLVEMGPQPMSSLDPDMGALVANAMRDAGIAVYADEAVTGFEASAGAVKAVVTEARTLPADIVVLGLGVRPNSDVARAAGIPTGPTDGVAVDSRMRTPIEGVWAAGDCAEKLHRITGKPVSIALGTHANKEGRVAGINIGGDDASFPGVLGTAASKVCEVEIARTGLNESEARDAGFEVVVVVAESTTRAGYYPGAARLTIKLIVQQGSGRLLGAQIVGREGAGKRIDVLAAALWTEMTVDEIINLDLSYAPPLSPVWDPVLIAARKAWDRLEETR